MARIVFTPHETKEVRALLHETAERYAVHGRKPFKARYVVRDLRKSRESRLSAASRVLY